MNNTGNICALCVLSGAIILGLILSAMPQRLYALNTFNDYYQGYYYNDSDSRLSVQCYPDLSSVGVNDRVTWHASVYGGNGHYTYEWDGSNSLSGSDSSVRIRYNSEGRKYASVIVRSGNQSERVNCSSDVRVYDKSYSEYYPYLEVSCYADRSFAEINQEVRWFAEVSGGDGHYTYRWTGTDNVREFDRNIKVRYGNIGTKYVSLRVTSGGRNVDIDCGSVLIGLPIIRNANPIPIPVYDLPPGDYPPTITTPVKSTVKSDSATTSIKPIKPNIDPQTTIGAAALIILQSIQWIWVAVFTIFVLFFMLMYLIFTRGK